MNTALVEQPIMDSTDVVSPIFICGTGRSGTTVLQEILQKHHRIFSTTYEGRFIVSPGGLFDIIGAVDQLPELRRFHEQMLGDWFQKTYRKGTAREYKGGLFVDIGRQRVVELIESFQRQLRQSVRDSARAFIEAFFVDGVDKRSGVRWMEKTPTNLIFMGELLDMFPLARIIHIIRDGRDVAASIVNNNFYPIADNAIVQERFEGRPINVRSAARFWRVYLEKGLSIARDLPETAYKEIRLEDLVASPQDTLKDVCRFIGEPFDPRMLDVDLKPSKLRRWPELFTEQDKTDFKCEAGDLLIRLGYTLDNSW